VSRYQKGKTRKVKTNLDLLEQEIVSGSGICWAICKSAPHPRQPPHHTTQFFTGRMPFLTPNQQCQSTEGKQLVPLLTDNGLGKPAPEKQNHYGKTNLDLLEQETVSGCSISWAICKCKSAPRLRQVTMPAPNHSFIRTRCPSCCPTTASKH